MDDELKVTIALISAGSAIAGAVVSQIVVIFRDFLNKKHQRKILLREKYEELALLVTENQDWLNLQMKARSMDELGGGHPNAARRAMVLAHIFFPKLRSVCEDYVNACAQFQLFLIHNNDDSDRYDAGTQAAHKNPEELERVASLVRDRRQNVDEAIIRYARKYANA